MIRRSTLILVAVFVILLGLALYLQRSRKDEAAQGEPTVTLTYLLDLKAETLSRLRISDPAGTSMEILRGADGGWTLVEPSGQPVDVVRIEAAVAQVGGLQVVSTLEELPALNVIGLQPPKYRLAAVGEDGREQVAFVGDQTPTQTGYYAHRDGGPLVVVSKFALDSLLDLFTNPPIQPTPPVTPVTTVEGSAIPEPNATP